MTGNYTTHTYVMKAFHLNDLWFPKPSNTPRIKPVRTYKSKQQRWEQNKHNDMEDHEWNKIEQEHEKKTHTCHAYCFWEKIRDNGERKAPAAVKIRDERLHVGRNGDRLPLFRLDTPPASSQTRKKIYYSTYYNKLNLELLICINHHNLRNIEEITVISI